MRVLFLDAYFEPEQIAFTHLEHDLLEGLVNAGHELEIVCPTPTRGITPEKAKAYKKRKSEYLFKRHIHIIRFSAPQEGKNPILRALRYFWCNLRTYQIGKDIKDIDVVFCNSTPPTQGWIAGKVSKKLRAPLIYSLQDVFPDSLVTTGMTSEGSILWKIGRKLEDATYKRCKKIIVISDTIKKNLIQKGVNSRKLEVISNWIDTDVIRPVPREKNKLFDEFGIDRNKFIVLYAGNFGAAQGAEIVLEAAEMLKDQKDIQFVIFGGGAGYQDAVVKASIMPNVFIHPLMPQDRVADVYSMGNVAIITCKKGVGKSGMPSKTWSIMACNTPIIAAFDVDSEMHRILLESKSGRCIEAEDKDALIEELLSSLNNMGDSNGREFVTQFCSKANCVKKYIDEMRQACENTND